MLSEVLEKKNFFLTFFRKSVAHKPVWASESEDGGGSGERELFNIIDS